MTKNTSTNDMQSCQTDVMVSAVFHGDCLDVMKNIPDESIDMILCDLPYGTTKNKWDVIIPFNELWEQYERIIKQNGAIALFAQDKFMAKLMLSNINHRYNIIWDKVMPSGHLNAKKMPLRSDESICVFYKKLPTYNPEKTIGNKNHSKKTIFANGNKNYGGYTQVENNSDLKYPKSIIRFKKDHPSIMKHPTQKPVELFEYLIKTYTNKGETVLDNCAGSGTTGIACINTNRNYILIEKEQKYIDIINERIFNTKQL